MVPKGHFFENAKIVKNWAKSRKTALFLAFLAPFCLSFRPFLEKGRNYPSGGQFPARPHAHQDIRTRE